MSFQQLMDKISSPALRSVAAHWNDARRSRRMPAWSDIVPGAIAAQLPDIWSWKYDAATDIFTGRLAGENIVHAFGESLRGKTAQDFFRSRGGDAIVTRHRRVVTEPCFYHGEGEVFIHVHRSVKGERIILPLADDGETGDGILGATVYHSAEPVAERADSHVSEKGKFIPL